MIPPIYYTALLIVSSSYFLFFSAAAAATNQQAPGGSPSSILLPLFVFSCEFFPLEKRRTKKSLPKKSAGFLLLLLSPGPSVCASFQNEGFSSYSYSYFCSEKKWEKQIIDSLIFLLPLLPEPKRRSNGNNGAFQVENFGRSCSFALTLCSLEEFCSTHVELHVCCSGGGLSLVERERKTTSGRPRPFFAPEKKLTLT